ncbi:hypothetical protein ACFO25_09565 [Paenactinomyces guangxiensis]|uniref:Uncharacterized protein n=1 Tax=Paenactinomyces guangxiensis TaxID=1490290 RepID=A0A7W1WML1_9BACL|nr:hypothetical protein [Paenactinomyces guangxiensis]MBA4492713.1 hypothetical protein [Paenactinomyces guangxiensis]MBH8590439.1 hypothetical protein [Paenactinomyces guangxiensis]
MKQISILSKSLQSVFSKKEIEEILEECGHHDTARKFTVPQLLNYWIHAAIGNLFASCGLKDFLPNGSLFCMNLFIDQNT